MKFVKNYTVSSK